MSLAIIGDTLFTGTGYHGIWKRGLYEMAGGIEDNKDNRGFVVYPNPSSGKIKIEVKQYSSLENTIISIYNVQGKLLFQQPLKKDKTELDISGLEKGVYILKLTNNKMIEITKLVEK
jgi:ribosomal protein S11